MRAIHVAGTTVLLVEQDVLTALEVAQRGYVIANGRVVLAGSSAELGKTDLVR